MIVQSPYPLHLSPITLTPLPTIDNWYNYTTFCFHVYILYSNLGGSYHFVSWVVWKHFKREWLYNIVYYTTHTSTFIYNSHIILSSKYQEMKCRVKLPNVIFTNLCLFMRFGIHYLFSQLEVFCLKILAPQFNMSIKFSHFNFKLKNILFSFIHSAACLRQWQGLLNPAINNKYKIIGCQVSIKTHPDLNMLQNCCFAWRLLERAGPVDLIQRTE